MRLTVRLITCACNLAQASKSQEMGSGKSLEMWLTTQSICCWAAMMEE